MELGLREQLCASDIAPEISFVAASPVAGRNIAAVVKRAEDIIIALALIIMFSWLLVAIMFVVKITSSGPVLFLQPRRGVNGSTFRCIKFRTMHHQYTDVRCDEQTRYNDPRVTRFGGFLRKHSLDELPQLFNVICGDMSLVGPRPHALGTSVNGQSLHDISEDYPLRYQMRPGITGWAQVNGWRGILDTEEKLHKRVEHDLYYINNWSFFLDLRILVRTFACLFDNEQVY